MKPAANGVDVDITFRVEEKRTGNINFGASLGQGTGVGGFLGLEEPNLFGQGKRGKLQWQFGKNINDFTLSYSDPTIRESRISGTVSIFDSRPATRSGTSASRRQTGGLIQFGFPLLGARYTRLFFNDGLQKISYSGVRRSATAVQLRVVHPVHPWGVHCKGHPCGAPLCDRAAPTSTSRG